MMSCNPVTLPLDPNHKLRKYQEGDNIADISLYQQIIGSLMYLVIGTRPDLAFAISLLSQFSSKPTVEHFQNVTQLSCNTVALKILIRVPDLVPRLFIYLR